MERKALKSSQIKSVGYDEDAKKLEIEFMSGAIYAYDKVPLAVYEALMRAESPGHYFAVDIRACFEYECVYKPEKKKEEPHAEIPNPSLEKELRKSIKKAKAAKRIS